MTGLDRLHGIAEDVGRTVWLSDLGAALGDIADGIEGGTRDPSGYESDVLAWVEEHGGLEAVKKRMMPEGMSWPFYEDGEPVRLGEHWQQDGYDWSITSIDSIEFAEDGVRFENEYADAFYRYGERVNRPAPKVLDADGEPLEVGQTVYVIANGKTHHVTEVDAVSKRFRSMEQVDGSHWLDPMCFTHKRPVLDTDGVPIKKGDTVWSVNSGMRYTVEKVAGESIRIECRSEIGTKALLFPLLLTHERPDSFSLIEQDAELCPYDYAMKYGKPDVVSNGKFQRVDLVRRAKALAGVSE